MSFEEDYKAAEWVTHAGVRLKFSELEVDNQFAYRIWVPATVDPEGNASLRLDIKYSEKQDRETVLADWFPHLFADIASALELWRKYGGEQDVDGMTPKLTPEQKIEFFGKK